MLPLPITRTLPNRSAGFSLIEIMVGATIGMLGIIVMMQVFALTEGQRRSSVSGGDAQNGGAIAMYGLQRELSEAGFGNADRTSVGCDLLLRTGVPLSEMAPVTINHPSITGQDINTDTLLVVSGSSNGSPQGDPINSQPASFPFPGPPVAVAAVSPNIYNMATVSSFSVGDFVIAVPSSFSAVLRPVCTGGSGLVLGQVVAVNALSNNVAVAAGSGQSGMSGGLLFNQGATPRVMVYAIRNANLTRCDYMVNNCGDASLNNNQAVWIPIASDIVNLRAEYGHDTSAVNTASGPKPSVLDTFNQTKPTTNCGWMRVIAIRMVLVARSGARDKGIVTANPLTWEGTAVNTSTSPFNPVSVPINLWVMSDWQNYRYKTFETMIPLRNMSWNGVPPGC